VVARGLFLIGGVLGALLLAACTGSSGFDSAPPPLPPVEEPPKEEEPPPINPTDAEITLPNGQVFDSLGAAVEAAQPGDVLELGPGTYREQILIDKPLTLLGVAGASETILEGERRFRPLEVRDVAITLEGLTFLHGSSDPGGGLRTRNAVLTVRDCVFAECRSGDRAGAVSVLTDGTASAFFENCVFRDNSSLGRGGAIFAAAGADDQTVSIAFRECRFLRNDGNAGGVILISAGTDQARIDADFDRCTFEENRGRDGGAIMAEVGTGQAKSVVRVRGCLFRANSGTGKGGALRLLALTGSASIEALVLQCTFVRNANPTRAGGYGTISAEAPTTSSMLLLQNSIIFDNIPEGLFTSGLHVDSTNMMIDVDPIFVAPALNDFRLAPVSPAIDAGDPALLLPDMLLDLDGKPRNLGAGVDLGAFEAR
jgi:predicted outer membrane repeat protein